MTNEEILEAAKEAGLYMTSPERIAAVERLVAIIERRNSDRIEQLERQLAELTAEIAKYRDAPVVAYMHPYGGLLHSLSTGLERETYVIELIVKPGEQ